MEEILQLINNFGVTIFMLGYMVYKDYVMNTKFTDAINRNTETLLLLKQFIETEFGKESEEK